MIISLGDEDRGWEREEQKQEVFSKKLARE